MPYKHDGSEMVEPAFWTFYLLYSVRDKLNRIYEGTGMAEISNLNTVNTVFSFAWFCIFEYIAMHGQSLLLFLSVSNHVTNNLII